MNTTSSVPSVSDCSSPHPDRDGTKKNTADGTTATAAPDTLPASPAVRPHRRWSEAERIAALAALKANDGDMARTSLETGVPKQTLWNWTHPGTGARAVDPAKQEAFNRELADVLEDLAHKLIAAAVGKMEKASFKDCMIGLGIAIDKMQLLRNKPTEIVEEAKRPQPNYESLTTEQLERLSEISEEAHAIIATATKAAVPIPAGAA